MGIIKTFLTSSYIKEDDVKEGIIEWLKNKYSLALKIVFYALLPYILHSSFVNHSFEKEIIIEGKLGFINEFLKKQVNCILFEKITYKYNLSWGFFSALFLLKVIFFDKHPWKNKALYILRLLIFSLMITSIHLFFHYFLNSSYSFILSCILVFWNHIFLKLHSLKKLLFNECKIFVQILFAETLKDINTKAYGDFDKKITDFNLAIAKIDTILKIELTKAYINRFYKSKELKNFNNSVRALFLKLMLKLDISSDKEYAKQTNRVLALNNRVDVFNQNRKIIINNGEIADTLFDIMFNTKNICICICNKRIPNNIEISNFINFIQNDIIKDNLHNQNIQEINQIKKQSLTKLIKIYRHMDNNNKYSCKKSLIRDNIIDCQFNGTICPICDPSKPSHINFIVYLTEEKDIRYHIKNVYRETSHQWQLEIGTEKSINVAIARAYYNL